MWGYIIGGIALGATIFGLIVGIFSVYNGRETRRHTQNLIREFRENTEDLIKELREDTNRHLERLSEQHGTMIKQHDAMIEILKTSSNREK